MFYLLVMILKPRVHLKYHAALSKKMCLKGQPEYCHQRSAMLVKDLQADDSVSQV